MSVKSGGTLIMGLSKKFVILFAVVSLPVMVMYQNCSKTQNFEMNDMTSSKLAESGFDSSLLPASDGPSGEAPSNAGSDINKYQVEPRDSEVSGLGEVEVGPVPEPGPAPAPEIVGSSMPPEPAPAPAPAPSSVAGNNGSDPEFLADCSVYTKESQNPNPNASFSNDSASGVQGHKVLTPEDFGGNRNIKSISNTGGHIVLCNLEVENYSDSNGRVDLVNSHAVFTGKIPKNINYYSGK